MYLKSIFVNSISFTSKHGDAPTWSIGRNRIFPSQLFVILLITVLGTLHPTFTSFAETHCIVPELLEDYTKGALTENAPTHLEPKAEWRLLGEGIMGGRVFRVIPSDGRPSYVIKEYKSKAYLENDVECFRILREVLDADTTFSIVGTIPLEPPYLRLSDVKGTTAAHFLNEIRSRASRPLRLVYEARLNRAKELFQRYVQKQQDLGLIESSSIGISTKNDLPALRVIIRLKEGHQIGGKNVVNFFLKADNIVIDAQGQMWIIDPY